MPEMPEYGVHPGAIGLAGLERKWPDFSVSNFDQTPAANSTQARVG
jgi:hypothetical protein